VTDFLLGGAIGSDGALSWTTPQWVVLLAASVGLVTWLLSLRGERSGLARAMEGLCWAAAIAGLVVAIAGPLWVEEEGRTEAGRVAVLVDASRSMSILEEGSSRSAEVEEILAHVRRSSGDSFDLYHFGDDLSVGAPTAYDQSGTDLEGALDALSERVAGESLASLVVITDGLDRGLLRRRYQKEEAPAAPDLPGPLTVFQVGSGSEVSDLAVRSVDAGGYAFIRSPFTLSAHIEGVGFEGRTVPVTLSLEGATVTTKEVKLDEAGEAQVSFEVVPSAAGRFTYEVVVPTYEGDAVPANNVMPVVVKVVRDRIRVLQVAGAPSWDVKFLRRFLKGDPSVQLVSFFILRTQRDLSAAYDDGELSLIQFPYRRLFDEDLWSFDVVIFQNFDYYPYFQFESNTLLDNIRKYVEQGGALVMLGGDRSFGLGDYGATPLASILPVTISDASEASVEAFLPQLTADGTRHPVTRLTADPLENGEWWSRLHPVDGTNQVLGLAPDAAALLVHPTLTTADGAPLPVLAVREAGAGRAMALTVDSSWRWSLSEAAQGRGNQAYLRFWKNSIRWLMKDSTVSRVSVDTPRENYAVGDEVRVVVRVRDPGFAAMEGAEVVAEVRVGGQKTELRGESGPDGDLVLPMVATKPGTHRLVVQVTTGGEQVGRAETVFAVTTRDPETDEVSPDGAFLQWLAARSAGQYHAPGELGPILRDGGAGRVVWDRRETPLWRAPALALWVTLFAGAAWIVRRRAGLR